MRKFIRKCERISIKSADFRTKRAGVLKWVFENIRKRSKIFENIQKLARNIRKYSKIFKFFAGTCANGVIYGSQELLLWQTVQSFFQ